MCGAIAVNTESEVVPTATDVLLASVPTEVPGTAVVAEPTPVVAKSHNAIDALIKRVNRKLANSGTKLRKATRAQRNSGTGSFYLTSLVTGEVINNYESLEFYAEQFNLSTEGIEFICGTARNVAA